MNIKIEHKYLIFPVNTLATEKKLLMKKGEEVVYALDVKLDAFSPDFYSYVDVSRFMGEELTLSTVPEMTFSYRTCDTVDLPNLYRESYRPMVHFSTKNGWLNDPNGLICLDGVYHLFYQYNPCENRWGNMHWGHATSTDLLHWHEEDVALFPDATGMMFSGSAILDEKNLLGKQVGENKTALLFYTATTPYAQYVAYSTDSLKTVKKYSTTPIIEYIVARNRDPKVAFVEEWDAYVLALYLDGDVYALFRSTDLLSWELVQKIQLPGDRECPDIFKIKDSDGKTHWVLMGAHDRYYVGRFTKDAFVPIQPIQSLHHGITSYAGQSFSGLPDGRVVRMYWQKWNHLKADSNQLLTPCIAGQMSIPTNVTLTEHEGVYYLSALPIQEIESLIENHTEVCGLTIASAYKTELECKPYLAKIRINEPKDANIALNIFGRRILCDSAKNTVTLGTASAPLRVVSDALDIVMVVDKCSIELYLDGGRIFLGAVTAATYADYNLSYLEITSDCEITVDLLSLDSLKCIWSEEK